MRIFGLGTDIVETQHFSAITSPDAYMRRNFTRQEREYCDSKHYPAQHFAARHAAKEATLKSLARGLSGGLINVEVCKLETGPPTIILHGKLAEEFDYLRFKVSISHTSRYATATVISYFKE